MSEEPLRMWTVYDHPTDYPDVYVARLFEVTASGAKPTSIMLHSEELSGIRAAMMANGLTRLQRSEDDDAKIVEVWL